MLGGPGSDTFRGDMSKDIIVGDYGALYWNESRNTYDLVRFGLPGGGPDLLTSSLEHMYLSQGARSRYELPGFSAPRLSVFLSDAEGGEEGGPVIRLGLRGGDILLLGADGSAWGREGVLSTLLGSANRMSGDPENTAGSPDRRQAPDDGGQADGEAQASDTSVDAGDSGDAAVGDDRQGELSLAAGNDLSAGDAPAEDNSGTSPETPSSAAASSDDEDGGASEEDDGVQALGEDAEAETAAGLGAGDEALFNGPVPQAAAAGVAMLGLGGLLAGAGRSSGALVFDPRSGAWRPAAPARNRRVTLPSVMPADEETALEGAEQTDG